MVTSYRGRWAFRFECALMGLQVPCIAMGIATAPAWWGFLVPALFAFALLRDMRSLSWSYPW